MKDTKFNRLAKFAKIASFMLAVVLIYSLCAVVYLQNQKIATKEAEIQELIAMYQGTEEYKVFEKACIDQFTLVMDEEVIDDHRRSTSIPYEMFFDKTVFPFAEAQIRAKCEAIANQLGMTSLGRIYVDEKYFSINIYPITD